MILLNHTLDSIEHLIRVNPQYGLIATFIIAFIESLAIIGSVVPGSVTMSIIGSMVGAALLPLLPTLSFAFIGSYSGDILSFFVGKKCEPWVKSLAWVKKHQAWVDKAEGFIQKYGVISIIIGRFFGPMRSMVPMIAGALKMHNVKFLIAAIPSAALWTVVYLIPGILIGMFSNELQLFTKINLIIFICVLFSVIGLSLIKPKLSVKIDSCMQSLHNNLFQKIDYTDFSRYVIASIFLAIFIAIALFFRNPDLKYPLYYFAQSLHMPSLNYFMILTTFSVDKITFLGVIAILCVFCNKEDAKILILSSAICLLATLLLKNFFHLHRPPTIAQWNSFPSGHCIRASFLLNLLYLRAFANNSFVKKSCWAFILTIAISRLYLGAHWLPDVLAGIAFGSCFAYFTQAYINHKTHTFKRKNLIITCIMLIYTANSVHLINKGYMQFFLEPKQNIAVTKYQWSEQNIFEPYLKNRFHRPIEPLNLQWLAKASTIESTLKAKGWQINSWPSSWFARLQETSKNPDLKFLPALPKLYNNNVPKIIAFKHIGSELKVINLWQSHIQVKDIPIFIGNKADYEITKIADNCNYHLINYSVLADNYLNQRSLPLVIPPYASIAKINTGILQQIS